METALSPRHFQSRKEFEESTRKALISAGFRPIRAKYDEAGNCLYCGESGRCPGYHATKEIKKRLRLIAAGE